MAKEKKISAWSAATRQVQAEQQDGKMEEPYNGITEEMQNNVAVEWGSEQNIEQQKGKTEELYNGINIKTQGKEEEAIREREDKKERDSGINIKDDNSITAKQQNYIPVENQDGIVVKQDNGIIVETYKGVEVQQQDEEKNTEKITLYLTYTLYDKLEGLANEYRRRTRKRIDPNKLMRKMIERATIEELLP